jgi:hypothetical protein
MKKNDVNFIVSKEGVDIILFGTHVLTINKKGEIVRKPFLFDEPINKKIKYNTDAHGGGVRSLKIWKEII